MARLWTRAFLLLIAGHFLQALGYASMLLLPLYLAHLGASRTELGLMMGTAGVSGVLTRPLVAWALDAWGRKPTLVTGTLLLVVAMGLVGLVRDLGPLIYVQRVLIGAALGALFSGYFTWAADLVPVSRRTEGLALFGVSGLLPLLVNPLSAQIGVEAGELRWFLPLVGLGIALSLPFLLILPEPRLPDDEGAPRTLRNALVALRRRSLWPPWLATVAFAALVAVYMTFATVAAESRGVPRPATLWLSYALGAASVRIIGARLPDRLGPANLVAPALGLYVVALLVTVEAADMTTFLIAALLAGIGHGYCFPVLTSQVVSRTPDAYRGSALASFTALWTLSELGVSPIFGAVADAYGDAAMFLSAALFGTVCLALWVLLEHRLAAPAASPQ